MTIYVPKADTFNLTTQQVVTLALQRINVLGINEVLGPDDYAYGLAQINLMLKAWEMMEIHIWTQQEACIFLQPGQVSYAIGSDPACIYEGFCSTTITTAGAISDTLLHVGSTVGFVVNDHIGIQLSTGSMQWTTVTNVNSSTTCTIQTGLTATASVGASVFDYTTTLPRVLKMHNIRRFDTVNDTEIMMEKLNRTQYFNLPVKSQQGQPINWFYDPQLQNGVLYVYQPSDSCRTVLRATATRAISQFSAGTDQADFPNEWLDCLVTNLAVRLSHPYGKAKGPEFDRLMAMGKALQDAAISWDFDKRSVSFVPADY